MGQRTQLIVKVPGKFVNDNNPNNQETHLIVFHNQWLYGYNFLKYASRFNYALNYLLESELQRKPSYLDYYGIVSDTVKYSNNSDLDYMTNSFLENSEYNREYLHFNNLLTECKNTKEFLSYFDNNNGYMVFEITEDNKTKFGILSGLENTKDGNKQVDCIEYYKLFYADKDISEEQGKELIEVFTKLLDIEKLDVFAMLNELKTKLIAA